jgi:hypothetical protein
LLTHCLGIFGVVKTVLTLVWLFFLIDRLGRRWLLMIGSTGGSLCMWFVGGYIKIAKPEEAKEGAGLSSGGIAAIFMFYRKSYSAPLHSTVVLIAYSLDRFLYSLVEWHPVGSQFGNV